MKYGRGYRIITSVTAWLNRNIFYFRKAELTELLGMLEPKKILDLGCNTGQLTRIISKRFPEAEVHGADINKDAIKAAQGDSNIAYHHIDDRFYETHEFDIVLLSHVLEHVPDPGRMIENIYKILNKNGKAIIIVPQERIRGDTTIPQFIFNIMRGRFENPHKHKISHQALASILKKEGFKICKVQHINFFPPYKTKSRMLHSWSTIIEARK